MNLEHFKAFLWLRWRIRVNQLKRGGIANSVILILLAVSIVAMVIGMFIASVIIGAFTLQETSPTVVMFVWDGVIVAMLFFWMIGLLAELQRSESLSLDKFLHLPVSLSSAFLINYLSSLASLTMFAFVPVLFGLSMGLVIAKGVAMIFLFPLCLAFLLALTAVTYQFQGWLATLMANPRRKRTIVVGLTMGMILVFQLPNLVNILRPWGQMPPNQDARFAEEAKLRDSVGAGQITLEQFQEKIDDNERKSKSAAVESQQNKSQQAEEIARIANLVLPPGWVALGAEGLAEQNVFPALLGSLGLSLIGGVSLWRAYRTTVRLYTGVYGEQQPNPVAAKPVKPVARQETGPVATTLLERRLPWVSEQTSAIALASLRSLLRAPEVKMMLMVPVIMMVVFGSIFLVNAPTIPAAVRPFLPTPIIMFMTLALAQLVGNQFGYDRSGFRVYVLGPAPRRDVLLGKNLSVAPLALGIGVAAITLLQFVLPMRPDHYLAALLELVSVFLLFCLVANMLSIFSPIPIPTGGFKANSVKFLPVLLHMLGVFTTPLILLPTLLPIGLETLLAELDVISWAPIALVLSIGVLALTVVIYNKLLTWQGELLTARELKILDIVVSKAE